MFIWRIRTDKTFSATYFHWYVLPLVQSASNEFLFMKTHRVLKMLGKYTNVRYRKSQVFLWFTINWQLNLKKFSTLFLRYLPRKTRYSTRWWALWIRDPRNFYNSFFVKNYYVNLIFFRALQSALLKTK